MKYNLTCETPRAFHSHHPVPRTLICFSRTTTREECGSGDWSVVSAGAGGGRSGRHWAARHTQHQRMEVTMTHNYLASPGHNNTNTGTAHRATATTSTNTHYPGHNCQLQIPATSHNNKIRMKLS